MIADDLFSGAGGWCLAAEALGIHARGIENMPAARATRDAAGLTTIHDDVWTFAPDGQASGLIASPPCQTFSAAGKGTGRKALDDVLAAIRRRDWRRLDLLKAVGDKAGDDRTALVLTPLHFAMTNPGYQWLAWEQVPTVLPVWEACADTLRAYGWSAWTGLLHSETFGVPQTRKRAFLLASRYGVVTPPVATHSRYHNRTPEKLDEGVEKWVSMAEALGEAVGARTVAGGDWNPVEREVGQPSFTVTGQGRNVGFWKVVTGQNSRQAGGATKRFERDVEAPSPTVMGTTDRWKIKPDVGVSVPNGCCHPPADHGLHAAHTEQCIRSTTDGWKMVSNYGTGGDSQNRGERTSDQPAPTVTSKVDRNKVEWLQRRNSGPGAERTPRPADTPSYTIRAQGSGSHPSGVQIEPVESYYRRTAGGYARVDDGRPSRTVKPGNPSGVESAPRFDDVVKLPSSEEFIETKAARELLGVPVRHARVSIEEAGLLPDLPLRLPVAGDQDAAVPAGRERGAAADGHACPRRRHRPRHPYRRRRRGGRRMNLIAPRKSLYWTHRRAINEATAIAHNTGVRQRVELAEPTRHGTARFRIVPVTPPPVEGAVA